MQEENIVTVHQPQNFYSRVRDAAFVGAIMATSALVASPAMAAGTSSLDFTGASAELDGVKTAIVGIIGTLVVIIGIGIAWNYFKRSAK